MNKEEIKELKEGLGIDSWLELVKEDKNLNGAYISFAQYIHILEQENQQLKEDCKYYFQDAEELNKKLNEVKDERSRLLNQRDELQQRIEKAIELNEKVLDMRHNGYSWEQYKPYLKEQLEILKGEDE